MLSSSTLFSYTTLFRSLFLVFYIRCAVRVEGRHGFHPPSLPFGAFCLRPVDHRLVRIQDQSGTGVSEFNAVAARFPDVQEEGLVNGVRSEERRVGKRRS